jgi:hypothetical protein
MLELDLDVGEAGQQAAEGWVVGMLAAHQLEGGFHVGVQGLLAGQERAQGLVIGMTFRPRRGGGFGGLLHDGLLGSGFLFDGHWRL